MRFSATLTVLAAISSHNAALEVEEQGLRHPLDLGGAVWNGGGPNATLDEFEWEDRGNGTLARVKRRVFRPYKTGKVKKKSRIFQTKVAGT